MLSTRPGRRSRGRLVRDVVHLVPDVVPPKRACSPPGSTMSCGNGTFGLRRPGTGLRRRRGVPGSALGSIR
jgi:hypothetical protein